MGKKAKQAAVPGSTHAEAEVASQRNALYESAYAPVEREQAIKAKIDDTGLLQGVALSDVAQATKGSIGAALAASGGTGRGLGTYAADLAASRTAAQVSGKAGAVDKTDSALLGVIGRGNGLAGIVQSGLAASSRAQSEAALGKLRSSQIVSGAMSGAIGTLAGAAGYKYMHSKGNEKAGGK